jgi:hypothetical protein
VDPLAGEDVVVKYAGRTVKESVEHMVAVVQLEGNPPQAFP